MTSSSFVANEEKSVWILPQYVELLGFVVDLKAVTFHVPPHRVNALKQSLDIIIAKDFRVFHKDFVSLDRLPGVYVSCHGSSCTSLDESNVQGHLPGPLLGSTNIFVLRQSLRDAFFGNRTMTIVGI